MLRYVMLALLMTVGTAYAAPLKVVQRLPVGPFEYVLYENGNIYADNGMFRKQLDDGTGTLQLVGERNNIFILKKGSEIWQYDGKKWTLVDDFEGTTKLAWVDGACVAYKSNGDMYKCALKKNDKGDWIGDWTKLAPVALAAKPALKAPTALIASPKAAPTQTAAAPNQPESSSFTR